MTNTRPLLQAPIKKLVAKLTEKGFAKNGGTPTRFNRMLPFENYQIVKHFNQIWQGISVYYSFADNYGSLGRIHYILKYSCILTLASKLKLITAKKVFKKFGINIAIKDEKGKILTSFPDVKLAKPKTFHIKSALDTNPLARLEKLANATFRSKAVLDKPCTVCGSTENIEMHHVRKLRDSKKLLKSDYLTNLMSRMNRKQVPICRPCHIKYHRGEISSFDFKNQQNN
jgi:hypothetical protein